MKPLSHCVFVISNAGQVFDTSCRVGALHYEAFHGHARRYTSHSEVDLSQEVTTRPPSIMNGIACPLKLRRSGLFLPPVTIPWPGCLVVTEPLYQEAIKLPNLSGLRVTIDRLVELKLPALADWSWYDVSKRKYRKPNPELEYVHQPEIEDRTILGPLYELVGVNLEDVVDKYDDWNLYRPNFGTYVPGDLGLELPVSLKAMADYPLVEGVLRQDLFAILAPQLDLDYFSIAVIYPGFEPGKPM